MRIQRQTPRNTGEGEAHATPHQRKERKGKHQRNSKQANTGRRHSKDSSYIPSVCTAVQNRRRPPACQSESCHLRPNERSRKSGIDFGTSRPGNPTPRQNRAVSPAANTDHIRRKGKALRSRSVRTRPAQASEPQPQQQGAERLRSAIRRMYKRAGADKGIVPLSYRRRSTPALCYSQNERARPRKRRNNIPNSNGKTPVLCHSPYVQTCRRR